MKFSGDNETAEPGGQTRQKGNTMKFRTTQKAIKSGHSDVIRVGYCNLQHLLKFENPIAYTTRVEGWAADVYSVKNRAIVTGYAPFGNIKPPYDLVRKYDDQAMAIATDWNMPQDIKREKISALLDAFIDEVSGTRTEPAQA